MTIYSPTECRENITSINKVPWGWGRLPLSHWWTKSNKDQYMKIINGANLIRTLGNNSRVVYLYKVRRKESWKKKLGSLLEQAPNANKKALSETIDAWVEYLDANGLDTPYDSLVSMQLDYRENPLHWMSHLVDVEYERINPFASEILTDQRLQKCIQEFSGATAAHGIEPLTPLEIAEFYRDHNFAGMAKPPMQQAMNDKSAQWPSESQSMEWLMPNPVNLVRLPKIGDCIRIDGPDTPRYQQFLAVALFPQSILAPGYDLWVDMESWGLPVDALFRYEVYNSKFSRFISNRRRKAAHSQNQHSEEAATATMGDAETAMNAEYFHREVTKSNNPLMKGHMIFKLTAETPDDLARYKEELVKELENKGVVYGSMTGDQDMAYDAFMPQNRWKPMGYKLEPLPDRMAAITLPGVSEVVGDTKGMVKGHIVSNGRPFRLYWPEGILANKSSVIVSVGPTGSGKTHLLFDLARDTLLSVPSRGIGEDPKGQFTPEKLTQGFPGYKNVQFIRLKGSEYPGALDPFLIIPDLGRAKQKAIKMVQLATFRYGDLAEELITEAVDQVGAKAQDETYEPSMIKVIEELRALDSEEAIRIGNQLERIGRLELGQLVFGDRNRLGAKQVNFPETGFILLQITDLSLPDENAKHVDIEQKASLAVNYGKTILKHEFLLEGKEKGVFSFLIGDESWTDFLSDISAQEAIRMTRLGRSGFCGIAFASQNPSDIPPEVLNNGGTYICLGAKSDSEVKLAMRELQVTEEHEGVDKTLVALAEAVEKEQAKGIKRDYSRAFIRDLYGRTNFVEFRTPQAKVRRFLENTPVMRKEQEIEPIEPAFQPEVM